MPSLYINGKWVEGHGPLFSSQNPANNEVLWEGQAAQSEDIDLAVKAARGAFEKWARTPGEQRADSLQQFARQLSQQKKEFALHISQETGKPYWESQTEVGAMIRKVAISLEAYKKRCEEESFPLGEATRLTRYKPHGVVAVFGPFNLPGHLPNGHIIPALLAGNTVVFKPSELTPLVGQRVAEIFDKAGLPAGVMNLVQGGKETGMALSQHPQINGLFFTGSANTGKAIHQTFAGRPEKILALEMGGNNPLIVFDVKDLTAAAYLTIQSAFITSGQRCVCARRLIIPQGRAGDLFVERLLDMTKRIRIGPFTDQPEPFMGPVISQQAVQRLLEEQEALRQKGGNGLLKMEPRDNPALLTCGIMDVTGVANRPDKEIFGPFIQLIRVKDFDAAIAEANDTAYGLSAGLFSDDPDYHKRFFNSIRAGIVNVNRPITGASSEAPFGGVGQSGNHHPSAYFAADYCSFPVASIEQEELKMPADLLPGVDV